MELPAFNLFSDKDVLSHYDRTILDVTWLEKMVQSSPDKGPAYKHYSKQLKKEIVRLEALEEEMKRRNLFQ